MVFVTDEQGNPIRHPIKMPDFQEKPRFYETKGNAERIGLNGYKLDKSENAMTNNRETLRVLLKLICLRAKLIGGKSFKEEASVKKRR